MATSQELPDHYTPRHGAWCLHLFNLGLLNEKCIRCMKRYVGMAGK